MNSLLRRQLPANFWLALEHHRATGIRTNPGRYLIFDLRAIIPFRRNVPPMGRRQVTAQKAAPHGETHLGSTQSRARL
jgi:hypothetical protein